MRADLLDHFRTAGRVAASGVDQGIEQKAAMLQGKGKSEKNPKEPRLVR
jgi:hypothetical protein